MSPLYSWLAVFAVTAVAIWYYSGRPNLVAKIIPQTAKTVDEPLVDSARKRKSKTKRTFAGEQVGSDEGTSTPVSSVDDGSKRRKIGAPSASNRSAIGSKPEQHARPAVTNDDDDDNDDNSLNNKEFAKQFTQARSGTPIVSASGKARPSKKDRRTKKDNLTAMRNADNSLGTPATLTDVSSTTGADGDDDLSPVGSPPLGATTDKAANAGDVSDMLEASSPGPAVLRLTDPKGAWSKVPPKPAAKAFEAVETKKQRQARQKREAAKAANEEAERERRKLMEKQIRGARMAEGTSAQSKTASFKPPTENAWFARSHARDQVAIDQPVPAYVEELDVREPAVEPGTHGNGAPNAKPLPSLTNQPSREESVNGRKQVGGTRPTERRRDAHQVDGTKNGAYETNGARDVPAAGTVSSEQSKAPSWADDVISEEEQMRMALEEQDSWKTVSSKKDRRKGGKVGEPTDVSTTSEASVEHLRANDSAQGPLANGVLKKNNEGSNRYAVVGQDDDTWEAS